MTTIRSAVSVASDIGRLTMLAGNLWLCQWTVKARRPGADGAN